MKTIRELVHHSPLLLLISVLIAASVYHPAFEYSSEWIIALGQLAFLPLLLCLGRLCFPSVRGHILLRALGLALVVMIPLHLVLMMVYVCIPGFTQDSLRGFSLTAQISHYLLVFIEESLKITPLLILYRSVVRESDAKTGMAVGFFSGLVFGCYENIAGSGSYDLMNSGEIPFGTHIILSRVLFWAMFHALLAATSAAILMATMKWPRFLLRLACALGVSSLFHFLQNIVPGYKFGVSLALVILFSILYSSTTRAEPKNAT